MKPQLKAIIVLYLSLMISTITLAFLPTIAKPISEYDRDIPLVNIFLEDKEMTWKVASASGVFANELTQPNDLIRYEVDEIDLTTSSYTIQAERKEWSQNDFAKQNYYSPTYYLISRNWAENANNYFIAQDGAFWGSQAAVDNKYKAEYLTEWYNGLLINTVTISFMMNDTNWDIIKYAREEGIMLWRRATVDCYNSSVLGNIDIQLVSYTGIFALSPWWYIIVVLLMIAAITIVSVIIAQLIKRRKRMWKEIDEI